MKERSAGFRFSTDLVPLYTHGGWRNTSDVKTMIQENYGRAGRSRLITVKTCQKRHSLAIRIVAFSCHIVHCPPGSHPSRGLPPGRRSKVTRAATRKFPDKMKGIEFYTGSGEAARGV